MGDICKGCASKDSQIRSLGQLVKDSDEWIDNTHEALRLGGVNVLKRCPGCHKAFYTGEGDRELAYCVECGNEN